MGFFGDLFQSSGGAKLDSANADAIKAKAVADAKLADAIVALANAPIPVKPPMSTGTKVLIGAGCVVVFMTGVFLLTRKKK